MQALPASTNGTVTVPPPLTVAADMAPRWTNLTVADFDDAAHAIVTAHKNDGAATDVPVMDLRTWGVIPAQGRLALAPLGKQHGPLALRSNGFSNLAAKLGAPADFVRDKLPAPLQLGVMNWLLASGDKPSPAMLRLRGDQVAAVVSDRYCPLDQEELMTCVRAALAQQGALDEIEVKSIATGLVDVIRLVFPAEEKPVRVGDVSALGLDISSSSFGKSAVHVRGLIWRLKCTNGMRVAEGMGSYSFRHVGDIDRMRAGVAEAIPSALAVARGTFARWRASVNVMVREVAALIDSLRDLTIVERKQIQEEVQREAGTSALPEHMPLYGFLNGVTAAAHHALPARRLELESLAGELLVRHTDTPS
jgi:hypothetical protein